MKDSTLNDENKTTDMLSSLIHEFLYKKEYIRTLDTYQEELSEKIRAGKYYSNSYKDISDLSLIKYFELGNKIEFMKHWKRMIPNHIKLIDPELCKLDFYLEIYFALFPILGNKPFNSKVQAELKANMEQFKKYLEQKEIELSKTTEFLAYYALPYIPNPKGHPSYEQLFKPEWISGLKEQIQNCVKFYLPSPTKKYPVLYDLAKGKNVKMIKNDISLMESNVIKKNDEEVNKQIRELKKENENLQDEIKKLKIKDEKSKIAFIDSQKTWTSLALNIITYSFGLIDIYNKSNNNNNPQIDKISKKLIKYQNFLRKNVEELEKNKNSNNSNLILKKEEIDVIDQSKCDDNNQSITKSNTNNIHFTNSKKVNPKLMQDNQGNILSNINTLGNNDSMQQNKISTNINNISTRNNNNDEINERHLNMEEVQQGKSIQIDYEPGNLIDMKRFVSALNHKIKIDDNKLVFIFRELRLRIFRRNNPALRQTTLFEIFQYDLFGTLNKNSVLFKELLSNQILNLEVMKLLNSLASLNKGRNYLLAKDSLIDDIVKCMKNEKTDSELRQNCLGTIQKFTLRAEPQNRLIQLNVIHYIIDIFSTESESLSDYTIEYGLALIMNLSLRKAGREKFELVCEKTLEILLKFMDKDNIQVLTCINGTLYSLLKKQKFKIQAKKIGLENKLKNATTDNQQLKKQILYILEELNNPPEEENEYDENFEEDINAKDEEENNFDDYADVESIDGSLLEEHYKILGDFIIRDNETNKLEEEKVLKFMKNNPSMAGVVSNKSFNSNFNVNSMYHGDDKPLRRPTTPMSNLSMTGTSQVFKDKNNYKDNNEIEYDNKMFIPEDSANAFMKKDKIQRTPPRDYNK